MVETIDKELLIQEIVSEIEKEGNFSNYTRIQLESICDRYIIVGEDYSYATVMINKDASKGLSLKTNNIFYKFKDCMNDIFAIIKSASSLSMQNSLKNIMVVIDIIIRVIKITTIEIDKEECQILLALHKLNAYDMEFDVQTISTQIKNMGLDEIEENNIQEALSNLYEINCVRKSDDDKYGLNEIVCCQIRR